MNVEMSDVEARLKGMEVHPVTLRPTKDALEEVVAYLVEQLKVERADDKADRNLILTLQALLHNEDELNGFELHAKAALHKAEMDGTLPMLAGDEARAYLDEWMFDVALAYAINYLIDNDTELRQAALTDAEEKIDLEALKRELTVTDVFKKNGERLERKRREKMREQLIADQEEQLEAEFDDPDMHEVLVAEELKKIKDSPEYKRARAAKLAAARAEARPEAMARAMAELADEVAAIAAVEDAEAYEVKPPRMSEDEIREMLDSKFTEKGIDTRKLELGTEISVILGREFNDFTTGYSDIRITKTYAVERVVTLQALGDAKFRVLFDSFINFRDEDNTDALLEAGTVIEMGHYRDYSDEKFSPRLKADQTFVYDRGYGLRRTITQIVDVQIDGINARLDPADYANIM